MNKLITEKIEEILIDITNIDTEKEMKEMLRESLFQVYQSAIEDVIEGLPELHKKSESRSAELECSQGGYEYGIEDAINYLTQIKDSLTKLKDENKG